MQYFVFLLKLPIKFVIQGFLFIKFRNKYVEAKLHNPFFVHDNWPESHPFRLDSITQIPRKDFTGISIGSVLASPSVIWITNDSPDEEGAWIPLLRSNRLKSLLDNSYIENFDKYTQMVSMATLSRVKYILSSNEILTFRIYGQLICSGEIRIVDGTHRLLAQCFLNPSITSIQIHIVC